MLNYNYALENGPLLKLQRTNLCIWYPMWPKGSGLNLCALRCLKEMSCSNIMFSVLCKDNFNSCRDKNSLDELMAINGTSLLTTVDLRVRCWMCCSDFMQMFWLTKKYQILLTHFLHFRAGCCQPWSIHESFDIRGTWMVDEGSTFFGRWQAPWQVEFRLNIFCLIQW